MSALENQFIEFCIKSDVLRFGAFETKAGRMSPYFFNAGLFNTGSMLATLSDFYAKTLISATKEKGMKCDMIFGPAYKGITLAASVAIRMSHYGYDLPFAYNRKEAKDHGEGGSVVGAPLKGYVVIIDDVISAGTSVRESVELIRSQGAVPSGVLLALDRMEKGGGKGEVAATSAVEEVRRKYGIPVAAIATLKDLMNYLESKDDAALVQWSKEIAAYRDRYGVQ